MKIHVSGAGEFCAALSSGVDKFEYVVTGGKESSALKDKFGNH
jgi:hypothetical protein